jgi:arylsulfatase A-like enzyme
MRPILKFFLYSLVASIVIGCAENPRSKPNIIVILIDDLGIKDLGCYGQSLIETPEIDELAKEGMRWINAYSSCPVCSPSRVAILTGKNPARVHFTGHITAIGRHRHPDNSRILPPKDLMHIPLQEKTLAEILKPVGYVTISIGKWHVGGEGFWPKDQGFDENIAGWTHGSPPSHFYPYEAPEKEWNPSIPTLEGGQEGEYLTDRLTDEAITFIRNNQDKPFLVYLSHYAVHTPLQAPEELVNKYRPLANGTIDPVYAAMVESMDRATGRLLDVLEELNLTDHTLVIFASDNGGLATVTDNTPYRSGKGHLYEGGVRVPLIMRWPGTIDSNSISASPTISEDIFATIAEIADIDPAGMFELDGQSLVQSFNSGKNDLPDRDLCWYYPHYGPQGNYPGAAIRSGKYKLIKFYDPVKTELYDLKSDIGEKIDISGEFPAISARLLSKLEAWLAEVDPIMHEQSPSFSNSTKTIE